MKPRQAAFNGDRVEVGSHHAPGDGAVVDVHDTGQVVQRGQTDGGLQHKGSTKGFACIVAAMPFLGNRQRRPAF